MWVEAIEPSLVGQKSNDAKSPKDLPATKTFKIWFPEDEDLSITEALWLVSNSFRLLPIVADRP